MEGGLTLVAHPNAPRDKGDFFLLPYARGRVGDYDFMSFEAQVGSETAFAFDTRAFAVGLALRQPWIDLHAGLGIGGRLMVDQERGGIVVGSRNTFDWIVYLEGEVELVDRFWVTFGGQIGRTVANSDAWSPLRRCGWGVREEREKRRWRVFRTPGPAGPRGSGGVRIACTCGGRDEPTSFSHATQAMLGEACQPRPCFLAAGTLQRPRPSPSDPLG